MRVLSAILTATVLIASFFVSPAAAQTESWAQRNPGGASSPASRAFHAFAGSHGQYAYLFGGFDRGYLPAELWRYDHLTTGWARLPATGPAARKGPGSSFGAGKFVIFGGASGIGVSPYYNDIWSYTESTGKWTNASPRKCTAGRPCPDARMFPAMAYDAVRDYHVIFGGSNATGILGDTWLFRATTGAWTRFPGGTPSPVARSGSALSYVAPRGQVVLFGGQDGTGLLSDLWGWDGTKWELIPQNNSGPALTLMGLAYDAAQGRLVVFGGQSGPFTNVLSADTWTFDFASALWTNLGPTIGLEARSGTPMTYLPKYGTRLFFGGSSTTTVASDVWEGR